MSFEKFSKAHVIDFYGHPGVITQVTPWGGKIVLTEYFSREEMLEFLIEYSNEYVIAKYKDHRGYEISIDEIQPQMLHIFPAWKGKI